MAAEPEDDYSSEELSSDEEVGHNLKDLITYSVVCFNWNVIAHVGFLLAASRIGSRRSRTWSYCKSSTSQDLH